MAIGTQSTFKIHDPFIHAAFVETLQQESEAFNAASRNAIRMVTRASEGQYRYEGFFAEIANLVTRRDPTSTSAATDLDPAEAERVFVKLDGKIGPVARTLNSFRKIGMTPDEDTLRMIVGQQSAKAVQVYKLNKALLALRAAIQAQTALYEDDSAGTITTAGLVDALSRFGDGSSNIVAWVMPSKPYFDLIKEQISANILEVSGMVVKEASPVTLNRPVIVTDSASLTVTGTPNTYRVLGLVSDAAIVEDSEDMIDTMDMVSGLENLVVRYQAEFAVNLGLKGFAWDVANGGANPNDAALGTGTNWDKVATDNRSLAGVALAVQ